MKRFLLKVSWSLLLLTGLTRHESLGQVITSGPDSVVVRTDAQPLPPEEKGMDKPGKAALMSAIVPGLGQAYNNSYWKIPIIYATGGVLAYYLKSNHDNYLAYRNGILRRQEAEKVEDVQDRFTEVFGGRPLDQQLTTLKRGRDTYRRWRDYNIVYCILAYGLNITEAYVHAHLKGFDVGEELTLQVRPNVIQTNTYSFSPAFSLSLNLKK
jgi:hypothetical protein